MIVTGGEAGVVILRITQNIVVTFWHQVARVVSVVAGKIAVARFEIAVDDQVVAVIGGAGGEYIIGRGAYVDCGIECVTAGHAGGGGPEKIQVVPADIAVQLRRRGWCAEVYVRTRIDGNGALRVKPGDVNNRQTAGYK